MSWTDFDFFVTRVRYHVGSRRYIVCVQIYEYVGSRAVRRVEEQMQRSRVVSLIASGKRFATAPPDPNDGYAFNLGSTVKVTRGGFITTEGNESSRDNLDELPEY